MSSRWGTRGRALVFGGLALLAGCGTMRGPKVAPEQVVDMDPEALRKFQHEVEEYVELHQELLKRIPTVTASSTPEEIAAHRKKMTDAIRAERRESKQGEIFKPKVAAAFHQLLQKELATPQGPAILEEIRSGNPKVEGTPTKQNPNSEAKTPVVVAVNGVYPPDAPVSNVPPSLLLRMPPLPDQVKYAFVGRALILRDTEASVILDFVADAFPDRRVPK